MTTVEILEKARGLIDTPEKWCNHLPYEGERAICASFAIDRAAAACGVDRGQAWRALCLAATGTRCGLGSWNDSPERTHSDVMQAFDRAIAAEKAKVNP